MALKKISVDILQRQAMNMAIESGMDEDTFNKQYDEIIEELAQNGIVEDRASIRAYRRIMGALRKQQGAGTEKFNGFVFARPQNDDFGLSARRIAEKFLTKFGRDKAIEEGYINEQGKFLYKNNQYHKGIIPDVTVEGKYYGLFWKDGEDIQDAVPRVLRLNSDKVDTYIPLFKEIKVDARISKQKENQVFKTESLTYYGHQVLDTDTNILNYGELFSIYELLENKIESKHFLDNLSAVPDFAESNKNIKKNFCFVQASLLNIGNVKNDASSRAYVFNDDTLSSIQYWARPETYKCIKNLSDECDGLLCLNTYIGKDNVVNVNLIGLCGFEGEIE